MARGVPISDGRVEALGSWKERVAKDTRIARLVERKNINVVPLVLLDDGLRVFIGVEGVHENKRDIDIVGAVKVLDLANRQIKEGHAIPDLND